MYLYLSLCLLQDAFICTIIFLVAAQAQKQVLLYSWSAVHSCVHLHSGTAARKNAIASAEKLSRCASGAGFTNLLCKKHSSSTRLQVRASCRQASHSYFFIFSQMALAQRPASRPRTTFSIGSQTLPKSTPSGWNPPGLISMQSPRWTGARYV